MLPTGMRIAYHQVRMHRRELNERDETVMKANEVSRFVEDRTAINSWQKGELSS